MVVRRFALPVEPHEQRILDGIRDMGKDGSRPVTTLQLAAYLNIPRSTMNDYLSDLEGRLLVKRPWGGKKGWATQP